MPASDAYLPLAAADRSQSDPMPSSSGHKGSSGHHSNGHTHTVSGHKVRYSLSINATPALDDLNLDKEDSMASSCCSSTAESTISFEVSSSHKRVSVDLTPASASASGGDERPNDDYMYSTLKVQRVREVEEKRFAIDPSTSLPPTRRNTMFFSERLLP